MRLNKKTIAAWVVISLTTLTPVAVYSQSRVADSKSIAAIAAKARKARREHFVSYIDVDDKNCVNLPSPKYVIVAGNGGTNMDLRCPPDHPIMQQWRQQLGFGGFLWVSSGGGYATGKCCALKSRWTTVT